MVSFSAQHRQSVGVFFSFGKKTEWRRAKERKVIVGSQIELDRKLIVNIYDAANNKSWKVFAEWTHWTYNLEIRTSKLLFSFTCLCYSLSARPHSLTHTHKLSWPIVSKMLGGGGGLRAQSSNQLRPYCGSFWHVRACVCVLHVHASCIQFQYVNRTIWKCVWCQPVGTSNAQNSTENDWCNNKIFCRFHLVYAVGSQQPAFRLFAIFLRFIFCLLLLLSSENRREKGTHKGRERETTMWNLAHVFWP